jgi:hypothetical protein
MTHHGAGLARFFGKINGANAFGFEGCLYQGYFHKRLPKAAYMALMAENADLNITWLLTGMGKMLLDDSGTPGEPQEDLCIDLEVLHRIIKWVEERLEKEGKDLIPDKKARFIALAYKSFAAPEEGKEVNDKGMNLLFRLVV